MPDFYLLVPFSAPDRDNADVVRGRVSNFVVHNLGQDVLKGDVALVEMVEPIVRLAHLDSGA